jgi:hypothetical protein
MPSANTASWIRLGLLALPVYGLLTFWSTLRPQPNPNEDFEAYARFVSSTSYMLGHLLGSTLSTILAIFGVFALRAYLVRSRAGRLTLVAMVITVTGHALFLVISRISTFATSSIGRAYLAGNEAVTEVDFGLAVTATFMLGILLALVGILLALVGNVLLGVAVWRSGTLPRWAGAIWAASALMFYVLGAVLGQAITGSSLATQPVGAALMVISGGWITWTVTRQPSPRVGAEAQPRVQ